MGIPYGRVYTATAKGSVLKEVECENCEATFAYRLERTVTGQGYSLLWLDNRGAENRSSKQAEAQLTSKLSRDIDTVACPHCGWFQKNMCEVLRRNRVIVGLVCSPIVGTIALVVTSVAFPFQHEFFALFVGLGTTVVGILFTFLLYLLHNPNRSHPGNGDRDAVRAASSRGLTDYETPEQLVERYQHVLFGLMVLMGTKKENSEEQSQHIRRLYKSASQIAVSQEEFDQVRHEVTMNPNRHLEELREFGPRLPDELKQILIILSITAAGRHFDTEEWPKLVEFAQAMEMSAQEFEAVVETIRSSVEANS